MKYRIRPRKPLAAEVARIADAQYARAIDILQRQPDGRYEAVHEARKCFKRLRGLLRLIRPAAPKFAKRENARIRDIARTLSAERDAAALVEAMDRLLLSQGTADNHDTLFAIRDRLVARRDEIAADTGQIDECIAAAIEACREGAAAFSDLKLPRKPGKVAAILARGAADNYRHARRALERASDDGHIEDWHDLRKRIKYHRMHIQLLSDAWPGEMALRAEAANIAGEALGNDRDIDNLALLIEAEPDAFASGCELAILRRCMLAYSSRLHAEIRGLLANLLSDKAGLFESRIDSLWREARS